MLKRFVKVLCVVVLLVAALAGTAGFFVYTNRGSRIVADKVIEGVSPAGDISMGTMSGALAEGLRFENLVLRDVRGLPAGSLLKVQKLYLNMTGLGPENIELEVENAHLKFPKSDPIVIFGSVKEGNASFNLFSRGVDVASVSAVFPQNKVMKTMSGVVAGIDLYLKGDVRHPVVSGHFQIERLARKGITVRDCPGQMELQVKEWDRSPQFFGHIVCREGLVDTPKTRVLMQESRLKFHGPLKTPDLDLHGSAEIAKTKINIVMKGTFKKPELVLSSYPSMPQEKLLLMLATGQGWGGIDESVGQGSLSPDLATDFVDYFLLGGSGSKLAHQLGISAVSLKYDATSRGVEVKKEVLGNVEVGYGVEQTTATQGEPAEVTQKVGGEVKVTEQISVGVEREVRTASPGTLDAGTSATSTEPDDKVFLRYKKQF